MLHRVVRQADACKAVVSAPKSSVEPGLCPHHTRQSPVTVRSVRIFLDSYSSADSVFAQTAVSTPVEVEPGRGAVATVNTTTT